MSRFTTRAVRRGLERDQQHGAVVPPLHLRGSQALVAFTTRRYAEQPLVVQGAGAGGEVTASGVLAELLRIGRAQLLAG